MTERADNAAPVGLDWCWNVVAAFVSHSAVSQAGLSLDRENHPLKWNFTTEHHPARPALKRWLIIVGYDQKPFANWLNEFTLLKSLNPSTTLDWGDTFFTLTFGGKSDLL